MISAGLCDDSTPIDQDHSDFVTLTQNNEEDSFVVKFRTRNWNRQKWTSSMSWLGQEVVKFQERESTKKGEIAVHVSIHEWTRFFCF